MRKNLLHFVLFASVAVSTVACKDNKENEVEPGEAEKVAVASDEAVAYEIDTTASTIKWRGTKPTGEHIGTIGIQDGKIMATSEEIKSGMVLIDMNSLKVTDEEMKDNQRANLENHLKGTVDGKETDFFNVRDYPSALFEITGITEENGQTMLQGNLRIKEETKNIQFPVETSITGDELTIESQTFTLDRTDWGINYRSNSVFENLGDNFISDDMELVIHVTARRNAL